MKRATALGGIIICVAVLGRIVWLLNDRIAPLYLNSRIERLGETNLPRASIEKGATVYCRMKADDFQFPLPPGSQATNLVLKSGGFDTVHGRVEAHFKKTAPMTPEAYEEWLSGKLKAGGSVKAFPLSNGNGLLINFDYFGDK